MVKKMISFRCPEELCKVLVKEFDRTKAIIGALKKTYGLNSDFKSTITNTLDESIKKDFLVFFKLFAKNAQNLDITSEEKEQIKDIQRRLKNE